MLIWCISIEHWRIKFNKRLSLLIIRLVNYSIITSLIYKQKFVCILIIRLFKPSPHYQLLKSRGKQDPEFWKEVATVLVKNKYNIEISQNGYSITIYQRRPPHKLYFIVIDNRRQVIIGSNKKMVVTYMVKKLEVLIWFMGTWILKIEYCYNWYLKDLVWLRVKDNDNIIGYTVIVSVSTSYSRCYILALFSCSMTCLHHIL